MANVLCQIRGSKRLFLFPPADITKLQIIPGASSSSLNVFGSENLSNHSPHALAPFEAILHPGDVLFIPPLWSHAAAPVDDLSVAINIFFRNLTTGYAHGRDVYGNRDLQAYEDGRKQIAKVFRSFEGLPSDVSRFYLERLADELKCMALSKTVTGITSNGHASTS